MLGASPGAWGQSPFRAPSVFNFYLPNHQPSASTDPSIGGIATTNGTPNIPRRGSTVDTQDLFAPEFQIFDAVVANAWHNRTRSDLLTNPRQFSTFLYTAAIVPPATTGVNFSSVIAFNMSIEEGLVPIAPTTPTNPAALIEYLDRVLCNGTMTDGTNPTLGFKTILSNAIRAEVPFVSDSTRQRDLINGAMMTVMNSPFYLVRF